MFYRTHYIVKQELVSSFFRDVIPFASLALRETYSVKDVNGNLLGYVKRKRLSFKPKFWFEETNGTRHGEIHGNHRFEVYDDHNNLRATITMAATRKEERRQSLLALILALMPMIVFVAFLCLSLVTSGGALASNLPADILLIFLFSCGGLSILGLILYVYLAHRGRFGKPKWLIEDPEGQQLAEGNDFSLARRLKVLTPDGGDVIALVHAKRGLPASYHISIKRQGFDRLLILSYVIVMVHKHKEAVYAASR